MRRRYLVVAVLATVAALVGGAWPWAYATFVDTSAKDRIEADPPPPLFPDATVAPTGRTVAAMRRHADQLMKQWWASHDTRPHDAEFEQWLEQTLPGPPSSTQRSREVDQVISLDKTRTTAGVTASTWLEDHGKKDVWKLYAHDQAEVLTGKVGDAVKNDVDTALSMSKDVADALGNRYQQSAPYVLHPFLRTDHTVAKGQVCPCSYPSRHATAGAAALTFLLSVDTHRTGEYRWIESEIDYSRLYMAGHVISDLTGGALLGDMIGDYVVRTRPLPSPGVTTAG